MIHHRSCAIDVTLERIQDTPTSASQRLALAGAPIRHGERMRDARYSILHNDFRIADDEIDFEHVCLQSEPISENVDAGRHDTR